MNPTPGLTTPALLVESMVNRCLSRGPRKSAVEQDEVVLSQLLRKR
ncbi:MAG: hypothetical protein ACI9S9_001670 [Planctomycetota bacterium]|jgi:hypothetical protein